MHRQRMASNDRVFFPLMGGVFVLVALAGFWPSFVVPVSQGEVAFPTAIVFHAIVMFSWLGVFVVQALLPSAGQIRLHKRIGYVSIGLFLALWMSSVAISIGSFTSELSPQIRTLINNLFLLQVVAWVLSPVLFVMAIRARKKDSADHKRYMLLLTFFLIEAAASRIKWLPGMSNDAYWIVFQYLYLDVFLVALIVYDFYSLRRLAHATIVGISTFAAYQLFVIAIWDSALWLKTADHLLALFSGT